MISFKQRCLKTFKSNLIHSSCLQEFVNNNSGFVTVAIWMIAGILVKTLHAIIGPFSPDLFFLEAF